MCFGPIPYSTPSHAIRTHRFTGTKAPHPLLPHAFNWYASGAFDTDQRFGDSSDCCSFVGELALLLAALFAALFAALLAALLFLADAGLASPSLSLYSSPSPMEAGGPLGFSPPLSGFG